MTSAVDAQLALLVGIALVSSAVSVSSMGESLAGVIVFTLFSLMMPAVPLWLTNETLLQLIAMVLVGGFAALTMVAKAARGAARSRMATEIELKAALAQASSARTMAESASQAKSKFLATMSHELRTPLNAVIGGAQLLHVEKQASRDQSLHIDAIQKSGSHLLNLIENILDLSRVESGELPVQSYDFDLQECIESAASMAKLIAQIKGLVVYSEIDPDLPTWRKGDGQRLSQIILNLMGNAVKFTNEGEVKISVTPVGSKVRIAVSDTGVGIHPTELEFIFDPFHQADQGSKRRYGGSGLGLAIVKMWAQAMGGTVSVQSTLNKGSCFVLELPLEVAKLPKPTRLVNKEAQRHPNNSERARASTRHILVVEDDVINQKVVIGLLRSSGNRVSLAENGMQALATVAKLSDLDLILMDWFMPDIDGLEVTRRLRAGQAGESGKIVPIVALTANAFAQDREECLAAGMDDFLTKPVLLEDLERALEKWVLVAKPSTKAFDEPHSKS